MFQSIVVGTLFEEIKPNIITALERLNAGEASEAKNIFDDLLERVSSLKMSDTSNIEVVLNEYYVLQAYLYFLINYSNTWQYILEQKFSASWNSLQGAIGYFRDVKRFAYNPTIRCVEYFENQFLNLEELYPYGVFFSMGAVVDHFECSICGLDIDSAECGHRRGELFAGEMAIGIARNMMELDHVSVVTHPVDKRCVPQYEDDGSQFNVLRYFSELLIDKKLRPLDFGELEHSTRIIKNPDYKKMGRNEICYCGSGLKFKKCCIDKKNIEGGHIQIISNPETAEGVMA